MAKAQKKERTAVITGTTTIGHLVDKGIIGSLSKVRVNESGYPYCTVLGTKRNAANQAPATNIYFGVGSGESVHEGQRFNAEEARDLKVLSLEYSDGEKRLKLASQGESDYTDLGASQDASNVEKAILAELTYAEVDVK